MNDEVTVEEPCDIVDSATALASKEQERIRLQSEVEAFLSLGGKIDKIDDNVLADPPKKPSSSYGSQPI